ncbi:prepilin-type N-terminal cleavage/methylation domain-containing protein [Thermosynechococcus sichuanensis E542]|uniref:Prepilin-type N-terminal cleavage/methylation domain-containing protein n=1 Tax=Thermosynechococcus sichuanensis E542 TaxID=2016101 RepID=A0A7D6ERR4_9CYAN|nr:type IV pilin-like G/H family protein [Thermosynechococcus vestitus]QLL29706.1 prepilin-type N-terminal cleavage/methylation domain-containing protein [Thermosynechococcus vestitus E542]
MPQSIIRLKLLFALNEQLERRRQLNHDSGLSLPEVLAVIVIIGVIALIALPSLLNQKHKAQLASAKATVGAVNRAQEAYRVRHKIFATKLSLLKIYDTSGGGYKIDGYEPLFLIYDQIKDQTTNAVLYGGGNPWYVSVHAQAIDPAGRGVSGCVWAKPGDFGVTTASVKEGTTADPPGDCWAGVPQGSGEPVKFYLIKTTE